MSQINDALKKAKQAQDKNPGLPPPKMEMPPSNQERQGNSGFPVLLAIPAVVILVLAGGLVALALFRTGSRPAPSNAPAQPMAMQPPATPAPKPVAAPIPIAPTAVVPIVVAPPVQPAAVISNTPAPAALAIPTPPKSTIPKLQGISYRPERPSAVLNGKIVLVGGHVGEYHVLAITPEAVTIANATSTNMLELAP